jgi:rod shape-determining protein MreC
MRFIYTKTFAVFALCLIIIVIGLFLQVKGILQPIEYALLQAPRPVISAARAITSPVRNFFGTLFTLRSIVRENGELTAKVAQLQQQVVTVDQLTAENNALKKELGFVQSSGLDLQPCNVLAADPEALSDAFVISCGEAEGIEEGQAVVSEGYLVGKILHVGKFTSTALLITNANAAIDGRLSKGDIEGVIKGSFGSGIVLDMLSQNAEVNKGDIVVTAGINNQVAKNIVVGEVGEVLSKPNDLFKKVSIVTPIRFHDLSNVFVVKQ